MTNKKIFRVLVLAAFAAMVAIAPLQAADGCRKQSDERRMMGRGYMADQGCMMLKNIPDLTAEQKAKLEKLHAEQQKLMAAARDDMKKLATEMQALMKDPVDVKKAEAKIDELAKMRAGMQKKALTHRLAMRALLTDAQKAKLGEMGFGMGGGMMGGHRGCMDGRQAHGGKGMHDGARQGQGRMHGEGECHKKAEEK